MNFLYQNLLAGRHIRGESNSSGFYHFCVGSSCIYYSVLFLFICFLFLRIGIPQAGWDANKQKEKEKKRESDKKRENYINYCSVHRKGTIRLALDQKNNFLLNLHVYILCLPLFSQSLPYTTFQRFKQYFILATFSSSTKCNAV